MRSIGALGGHGILTEADLADLSAGTLRVYHLMKDGAWYSRDQICMAAGTNGVPAQAGDRRMRELRDAPWLRVQRERIPGTRLFKYRLQHHRLNSISASVFDEHRESFDDDLEQGEMFL